VFGWLDIRWESGGGTGADGSKALRAAQRKVEQYRDGYQKMLQAAHNTYARDRKRLQDVAVRVTQVLLRAEADRPNRASIKASAVDHPQTGLSDVSAATGRFIEQTESTTAVPTVAGGNPVDSIGASRPGPFSSAPRPRSRSYGHVVRRRRW
jgi:hypothetical protein